MSSITVLEAQGLVLPWGVDCPLDVSLKRGECVGLVGRNGVGKTVLACVLAGQVAAREGSVVAPGKVALLAQRFHCAPEALVADVLGAGARWAALGRIYAGEERTGDLECVDDDWGLEGRMQRVLAEVGLGGVEPGQRAEMLSGGEQTRLGLAALLLHEPACIILDEPTNNLDASGRAALISWMKQAKVGVIVISHDRSLLKEVDAIWELSSLGLRRYGGNMDDYTEQKGLEEAAALAEYAHADEAQKKVQRAQQQRSEKWAAKQRSGKGKALKRGADKITRYAARERGENTQGALRATAEKQAEAALVRKQEALARMEQQAGEVRIAIEPCGLSAGERVLELRDVSFGYGEQCLFQKIAFRIDGPQRVAVVGDNGSGKSTLLKLVLGKLEPAHGEVLVAARPVAYLDQHVAFLKNYETALDAVQAANPELSRNDCYAGLARFLFKNKEALRPVDTLSGGERVRLGLACQLLAKKVPKLIILDEPTNHLDLASVQSMERALLDYDGAILVVSHDEAFLEKIGVTQRVVLGA